MAPNDCNGWISSSHLAPHLSYLMESLEKQFTAKREFDNEIPFLPYFLFSQLIFYNLC